MTLPKAALLAPLLAFSACTAADDAHVRSLAANEGAHNIAILASGAGRGVSSSEAFELDLERMGKVLKEPPFSFDVRPMGDAGFAQVTDALAKAAGELGPDGTLLFFFSGHGSPNNIYKGDDQLSSAELNRAVAHGNYARFTALIEACESGSFAHGGGALEPASNYKSQLVMTAAKADEESADDGTDSYFPHYLEQHLTELAKQPNAKMRDLVDKVFQAAKDANPGQSGDMSAIPESLLDEPVHGAAGQAAAKDLFVALGAPAGNAQTVYLAAASAPYAALCPGDAVSCATRAANDASLVALDAAGKVGDRALFKSHANVDLGAHGTQTVLVFDSASASKPARSLALSFKPR
jgi:hypothetical protein